MIAQLTGDIISINPPNLVLDVCGVGYEILCPLNTFDNLNKTKYKLYTQLIVREDSHTLYGFKSVDEKTIFNELMRVNGVGAKVALAILSTLSIDNILSCVANNEVALLQQTPGIGKKTAQKLIVELQDRLPKLNLESHSSSQNINPLANKHSINAALSALASLGFRTKEAQIMLKNIDPSLSTQEIIHLALKNK